MGFRKGTHQWLGGQQWPPANRLTIASSSRTCQPPGSDSQPNPYGSAPMGSSVQGNSLQSQGQLGRLATEIQGNKTNRAAHKTLFGRSAPEPRDGRDNLGEIGREPTPATSPSLSFQGAGPEAGCSPRRRGILDYILR